jgi:hypothetical protein
MTEQTQPASTPTVPASTQTPALEQTVEETPAVEQIPTIGRIVHYKLTEYDVASIKQDRIVSGFPSTNRRGNVPEISDVLPAMIVRTWGDGPDSAVQLQVFLDGNDTLWATSKVCGDGLGQFAWPTRS